MYATFGNVVITAIDTDGTALMMPGRPYCGGNCDPMLIRMAMGLTNLREYRYGTNPNSANGPYTITVDPPVYNGTVTCTPNPVIYAQSSTFTIAAYPVTMWPMYWWMEVSVGAVTSYTFTNVIADHTISASFDIDNLIISGKVSYKGTGLAGVTMDGFPGTPPVTDVNGDYSGIVPYGWSGRITPQKTPYNFTPPSTPYTNATTDLTQDYDAFLAPATTKKDETIAELKVCSEYTDVSGYPSTDV